MNKKNEEDESASVYRNDKHMLRNISKLVYEFLKLPGAGYGLEIPVIYTFNGHEKAIEWIKSKIQEDNWNNRCLK